MLLDSYKVVFYYGRMYTIIRSFFVTLGIVFFLLLLAVAYIWFSNTGQVQTWTNLWLRSSDTSVTVPDTAATTGDQDAATTAETQAEPVEVSEQAEAMAEAGIDESFFTSLSDAEIQCFRDRLGSARVDSIMAGAMPSTEEIIVGLPCVE